jgi:RNA polymerase primary sigma factor
MLRAAENGSPVALQAAIAKLRLAPSFLVGLVGIAMGDPEAEAFRSAVERYAKARETMTVCNLRMVYNVVKRYQGHGLPFDDLLQEGNIGLMKAVERYDWRRGFRFSTYATWWIRQCASRALADSGRTIRIPVHVSEKLSALRRAINAFEAENGVMPTDKVLAELLCMPIGKISMLRTKMEEPSFLHGTDADGIPFEESLTDEPESRPDAYVERASLIEVLSRALSELDERSAEVLTLRYGLDGTDPRTLEATGEHFGVTRERIRQIESKALKRLAHPSRSRLLAELRGASPEPEFSTDNWAVSHSCIPRGHPRTVEARSRRREATEVTTRLLVQEFKSIPFESDAGLDDAVVSSTNAASHTRTNALIAFAATIGAAVEDKRRNGGGVSVRLPAKWDARSRLLARKLLGAGFKPYPGQVFV